MGDDDAVASLEEQLHPDNDPQRLKAALRALGRSHTAGSDELLWAQARRPAEEEPLHETVVTTLTAKPFPLQRTPLLGALDQGKKPGLKNALPILTEGAPTGTVSVENLEQVKQLILSKMDTDPDHPQCAPDVYREILQALQTATEKVEVSRAAPPPRRQPRPAASRSRNTDPPVITPISHRIIRDADDSPSED